MDKETQTVAQIAREFQVDHSTVLYWIGRNFFPNAKKINAPFGDYWVVHTSYTKGFEKPQRDQKKQKNRILKS